MEIKDEILNTVSEASLTTLTTAGISVSGTTDTTNINTDNVVLIMNNQTDDPVQGEIIQSSQTYISEPLPVTIPVDAQVNNVIARPMTVEEFQQTNNNPQETSETQVFTRPMTIQEYQEANGCQDRSDSDLPGTKCLVCEDRASGYHYSVFSCEGCKGFFKRTVQKALSYVCRDQGNCMINKSTRNKCQHCRYHKCVEMGMKKEAVREDRSPGGKHRHKRQKLEEMSGCLMADGSLSLISNKEDSQDFHDAIIETLIEAQPDYYAKADKSSMGGNISVNELMQYGYSELKYIIEWAKKVPGFQELSSEDQMCLLKSAFMELNVLRLAYRSMTLDNCIKFAEGIIIPIDVAQGMGWGRELVNATIEFTARLRDLKIDRTEFCILNALVLTYPDAVGIQEKFQVLSLQTKLLDTLRRYTLHNYPTDTRRYGKILLRLPSLRIVSAKAAEKFLSLTLDGSIQLNDLVFEMIT